MKNRLQFRMRIFSSFVIFCALLLVSRLYFLQVVHGDDFADKADHQYMRPASYLFDRGSIFFTSKDGSQISAATTKQGFLVALNPQNITEPYLICPALKEVLTELDCADVEARAKKSHDPYEEIARHIELNEGKSISDLKIRGVGVYKDKWRVYPGENIAAHVLGFVGYSGDELGGRYGLEKQYEDVLKRGEENAYANFFVEIFANINKSVVQKEELAGDIVTTIEPITQGYLEQAVQGIKAKWSSQNAGGIIIDPMTGEIFAMAIDPSFDPNNFRIVSDATVFSNDLVENVYEMGSIIKPFTMATAIDLGLADAQTTYNDTGSVTLNGRTMFNFDKESRGVITMQQAMGESLNTGFVYLSQKIGRDNLRKYFTEFGLGDHTGIDLPNEAKGLISNLQAPRDLEYANASFGQGIAMTPIATVRALSSLANGGTLITPHVVKEIKYKLGITKQIKYPEGKRVIKEETSEAITRILVENFDTYFQVGKAKNPHYSIAQKTGTAQIPLPNGTGYYTNRNLHSFFGYLPAYNPRFLVFLYTIAPNGARYSSESLGPTFVDITKFLINYYELPPDR